MTETEAQAAMVESTAQKTPKVRTVVPDNVSSIFCDGVHGMAVSGGVVRMNLYRDVYNPNTDETTSVVECVLMMPLSAMVRIRGFLSDAIEKMEKGGTLTIVEEPKE